MSLNLARVVGVHPEDNSVDLVTVPDGAHLAGIQVLCGPVSTNTGLSGLPTPGVPASGDRWDRSLPTSRDMIAVIGYVSGHPVVLGFLFPQVCQMLFARPNFTVERHPSDVYTAIDDAGNVEVYHPSGTYLRIGETPAHEDLTGQDFDKKFAISRNTDKAVHVQLQVRNAGALKATLAIDPDGNLTETIVGTHTVNAAAYVVNAPAAFTGASLTHNGVNVGATHKHGGVSPGAALTDVPS